MNRTLRVILLLWAVLILAIAAGAQAPPGTTPVTLRSLSVAVPQSGPPVVTAELGWDYAFPSALTGYRVYDRGDNTCAGPRQLLLERTSPTPPSDGFPRQTPDPSDDPIALQFTLGRTHCVEIVPLDLAGQEGTALNFPFALAVPAVINPRIIRFF